MSGFIHPLRPTDSSHLSQGDKVDDNDNEESKPSLTLNSLSLQEIATQSHKNNINRLKIWTTQDRFITFVVGRKNRSAEKENQLNSR